MLRTLADQLADRRRRKRKQSPQTIFLTLMLIALSRSPISTRRALTLLSDIFPQSPYRREPSPAAFSKMRHLCLTEEDLRDVFKHLRQKNMPKIKNEISINGHGYVAMDGSQIITPKSPATSEEFGHFESRHPSHNPQSRLVVTWDVSTRSPIHWITGTCHESERAAAVTMIKYIPKKSLVLLDRGFFGVQTLKAFEDSKTPCFMRIRQGRSTWLEVQNFIKGKSRDAQITIQDKDGASLTCRVIKRNIYSKRNKKYTLYVFVTTLLDKKEWPAKMLSDAYRLRWDIETSFREMKIHDGLENFRGKSSRAIRQEIAAYMIARLLTSSITTILHKQKTRISGQASILNMTCNHLSIMELLYDCFLQMASQDPGIISTCLHRLSVALSAMQKKRPKRSYPHKCKGRYGRWKGTKNHRKKSKQAAK